MKKLPVLIVSSLLLAGASILIAWTGDDASSPVAPTESGAGIHPVDIPPGFGYPGEREKLQSWAERWEINKITRHAWDLWAGMTSDSGQRWRDESLPVWETWCGISEAFSEPGCDKLRQPSRSYRIARQLSHSARQHGKEIPGDTAVVSFNKFNPMMASYLAKRHERLGAQKPTYSYTSMQSLADLNASWSATTSVALRKAEEAPYDPGKGAAIETKNVIFVVKKRGLTPIPLWQGPDGAKEDSRRNAVPESWLTCVLLDPTKRTADLASTPPVPASPHQISSMVSTSAPLSCQTYLYAPLATIYHTKMDWREAADWNNNNTPNYADAGDFAVLVGMHVNTKAIVNWTWQTFWWQPGCDTPNAFPGSKQGMTTKVKGPWRNYAMCTAWNQTQGNASKNMVVCFNPYLETSKNIPDGQSSNCMSCHATATAGAPSSNQTTTMKFPTSYLAPLDLTFQTNQCTGSDPKTCFNDFTRTDFSWAIPSNARNDLPQPGK